MIERCKGWKVDGHLLTVHTVRGLWPFTSTHQYFTYHGTNYGVPRTWGSGKASSPTYRRLDPARDYFILARLEQWAADPSLEIHPR